MISYDNYKNRIEKLAKAKRVLHKFRFLICGVLALVIGTTVGLMVAKGTYMSGMSLSAQTVSFNQPYEVTAAKAFLSSAGEQRVEYRPENGEWTGEKPVKAGKYSARTVTKKIVGYSYSPEVHFEITPLDAEFALTGTSVTYGDLPAYSVPQLISGHRVDESALEFSYASYGAPSTEVNAVESSLKIVDASGDDFTCCYNVTFSGKTLNIGKRNITVTPAEYEFTYDAQPHVSGDGVSDETLKRLVGGDTVTVTTAVGNGGGTLAGGAVEAGDYTVRLESVAFTHGGADISAWYNVTRGSSAFKINRRPLTVGTGDAEKVYDGEPARNTLITADNLVGGHTAAADLSTLPEITDVGTYENIFGVTVSDGVKDVTDNYEIKYNAGTLKITPASLTVITGSLEVIYNGRPWTSYNFGYREQLDYKFSVSYVKNSDAFEKENFTDAGTHKNIFAVEITLNGEAVTDNFDIEYVYGDIVIAKRNITITTGSDVKVYDGQPLFCDNPVVDEIVPGHRYEIAQNFSVTNVTGDDGVKNEVKYTVFDQNGREVAKNYDIEHKSGTLVIVPLQISVKTADASREYDGTPFSNATYVATRLNAYGTGLCGSDALIPTLITSRTVAGSQDNVCRYDLPTYDGVHTNYVIAGDIAYGTLTVEPKNVTVAIDSIESVYGEEIPEAGFTLDCGELPNDEKLSFTAHYERGGVTCTPEKWEDYTILDAGSYLIVGNGDMKVTGGNADAGNYNITLINGTLEVKPRGIIVTTATASHVYDGEEFSDTSYTTEYAGGAGKGLLRGDALTVNSYMTVRTIDDIPTPNTVTYAVPNGNYIITETKYGTLTITPRPVIVYTGSAEKTYDGTPLYNEEYTVKYAVWNETTEEWTADESKVGLIAGDTLKCRTLSERTHAGVQDNATKYENGNYDIKRYVNGTLTVNALKVHAKLAEDTLTYVYGTICEPVVGYKPYVETADAFVDADSGDPLVLPDESGQNKKLYVKWSIVGAEGSPAAGTYKLVADEILIYAGEWMGGFDFVVSANQGDYEITVDDATLIVEKLKFEVTVTDKTIVYGDSLSSIGLFDYSIPESVDNTVKGLGQRLRFRFTYKEDSVKEVGTYHFDIEEVYVTNVSGNVLEGYESNYEVTCSGTLTITAKKLTVYLDYYDKNEEIYYGTPWSYRTGAGNYARAEGLVKGEQLEITAGVSCLISGWTGEVLSDPRYNAETGKYEPNAGNYTTTMVGGKIYVNGVVKENGLDNYEFESIDGGLTVLKKKVEITFDGDSIVYGETAEGKTYAYSVTHGLDEQGSLPYGEILTIDGFIYKQDGEKVTPKDAGEYAIEGETVLVNGSADGAANYEVAYKGTLTIDKLELDIRFQYIGYAAEYGGHSSGYLSMKESEKVYLNVSDGQPVTLPNGEHFTLRWRILGMTVGEDPPACDEGYVLRADRFTIYKGSGAYGNPGTEKLDEGDGNNLKNYIINCADCHLSVRPREVTVNVKDIDIDYGDKLPESYDYDFEEPYLPTFLKQIDESLEFEFGFDSEVKDVGDYPFVIKSVKVYDKNGNLKEGGENNYAFTCNGTLTVTRKRIYARIIDDEVTYGEPLPQVEFKTLDRDSKTEITLPNGDILQRPEFWYGYNGYDTSNRIKNPRNVHEYWVSTIDFSDTWKVLDKNGVDITKNYSVVEWNGKLNITPKHVTVELNQLPQLTYGEQFSYPAGKNNFKNSDTIDMAYGEKLEVAVEYLIDGVVGTPKDANYVPRNDRYMYAYSARLNSKNCKVYAGEDAETPIDGGINNYVISGDDLENLQILKRNLYIYVSDMTTVYGELGVTKNYPDYPENYDKIEYLDGENRIEGAPYGEKFKINVEYLDADGNYIYDDEGFPIEFMPKNVGRYTIGLNLFGTVAYNEDGSINETGLSNYIFAAGKICRGALEIVPKEIRIALSSYSIEYGDFKIGEYGTFEYPDKVNNYDLENSTEPAFAEKFKVQIKYQQNGEDVTPKNVGKYVIAGTDFTVYDGDELADKDNYKFVGYTAGELEITQRLMFVKISSEKSVYGKTDLPEHSYELTRFGAPIETAYGETFTANPWYYDPNDIYKQFVTPRNAGEYGVTIKSATIGGEPVSVWDDSANYFLSVMDGDGTLTIERAKLNLQLLSMKDALYGDKRGYPEGIGNYDDSNTVGIQYNDQFEIAVLYEVYTDDRGSGLVRPGDVSADIPTNAATYHVNLDAKRSVIHTTEGKQFDLELNYETECEFVNFKIWFRVVEIGFSVPDYIYGQTVEKPVFNITVRANALDESVISATELPYGETCDFDFVYVDEDFNSYDTPLNAGTYNLQISKKYVNGSEALAKNYMFGTTTASDTTLTISKKSIEITLDDMVSAYGDFENNLPQTHTFTPTEGVLEYTDSLTVHIKFTQVGKEGTTDFIEPKNKGFYSVVAHEFTVEYSDGSGETAAGDGLLNYEIKCDYGTLEITPKRLHVAISKEVESDYGQPLPEEIPFTVTSDGEVVNRLPYGDNLAVASYYNPAQPKNAGEYAIVYDGAAINLNENDPNYEITGENGLLTIKQKKLTVTVYGGEGTYGYTVMPEIKHEITEGETVGEEELVPAYVFSLNGVVCDPVNAGEYEILIDEEATTVTGGNALYSNYAVTYVYEGKLVIKASPLTVKINGDSFVYGERDINVTFEITGGELFNDEKLQLTYTYINKESGEEMENPTAAGEYEITAAAEISGGNASVDNYKISYVENDPALVIEQREIEIKLNHGGVNAFTYGDGYDGEIRNAEVIGAVDGQTFDIAVTYAVNGESASKVRRARSFSARAAEAFIPKDAGAYIASLDFANCVVTAGGNPVEGGIGNYKLKTACADAEFEITPKSLTVNVSNAKITYGSTLPAALGYGVAEEMPYGESLELTFSFELGDGKLPVHVGNYPVQITDTAVNGGKLGNYKLNYTNENPQLTIEAKPVGIRLSDLKVPFGTQVVYRVEAGNYNLRSSDSLVDGDVLTVTEVKYSGADGVEYTAANAPVNAGDYDIIFVAYSVVNAAGEDATADYAVTKRGGTLTIASGLIIIYTASAEKEYDGTALSTEEYESYEGNLLGYKIVVDKDNICEQTDVTAGDGADNTTKFKIVDEHGVETDNLELRYGADNATYGKLKVTPRPIEIKSYGGEKEYDGTALTAGYELNYKGATENGAPIAARDTFKVEGTVEQIDVGETENTVYFSLTNIGNYQITTDFGRLKVTRKYVEVTIDRASAVYGELPAITFSTDVALASGESLSFSVEYFQSGVKVQPETSGGHFILPAGKYRMSYEEGSASIGGGRGLASNYDLTFVPGAAFEVTPRHIIVTTATDSAEYDGSAFSKPDGYTTEWVVDGVKQGADGLLGEDALEVQSFASQTDIGSFKNVCAYGVSANYEIDGYDYGTLTVTGRLITVKTEDVIATYDGEPHSGKKATDKNGKLVEGHMLIAVGGFISQTDVTSGVKNVFSVTIEDADGNDVTANYSIEYDYGSIVITRRPLEITTGGVSGVDYDGLLHGNTAYEAVDGLLTDFGHELSVDTEFKYANATAGTDNKTTYKVYCGGKDLSGNYAITYNYGKIIIGKRSVTVTLNDNVSVEYGGNYRQQLTRGAVTLINGEMCSLAITTDREVDGVGFYTATADWQNSVIRDASGKIIANGADNYAPVLAPEARRFEIIQREIEVTLNAGGKTQFTYGENYDTAVRIVRVDSMIAGETLQVAVNYVKAGESGFTTPKFVGNYTAQIDRDGCTVAGGDIANYNIVLCDSVSFEIVAKDLTVYMDDITVGYGETPAYPDGASGYTRVEGLLSGETLTVTPAFEKNGVRVTPDFADEYDIVCGAVTVNGGAVGAENYNIITGKPYGTLTVTGVGIVIVRKTVTKTYDGEPLELSASAPEDEVGYIINGDESLKLPAGYRLELDGAFATADGNVSSSCANTAVYKVVDESTGGKAGNYVVSHEQNGARLIIERRVVNVTTDDATRKYNGLPLTADCTYNIGELVSGHVLTTSNHAQRKDVGSVSNTMDITITANGANVTANYQINVTNGTLKVEELPFEVEIPDITKVYGEDPGTDTIYQSALVNGEKLNYRVLYTRDGGDCDTSKPLDVGDYGVKGNTAGMSVSGGKLSNYIISFKSGATLTVTKRHIIVTTATDSVEYSGAAFSKSDGYTTEWVVDGVKQGKAGLVGGDTLEVLSFASQTEIGSFKNVCTYKASDNYEIDDYEYGTLTVTRIAITVTTNGINGEYRGTAYSDGGFEIDEDKLLAGHTAARTGVLPEFLDATDSGKNEFAVVITAGGADVTEYYDITYVYGKVVITKRALTVTLDGSEKSFEYGDGSFDAKFKVFTASGLAADDELTVIALTYNTRGGVLPVNAGNYTAKLDVANSFIKYAGAGNGIGNYEISCAAVNFEITRKKITVSLGDWAAEEYDGNTHAYDSEKHEITEGGLVEGERIVNFVVKYCSDTAGLVSVGTPKDAGTYYVFLDLDATKVRSATAQKAISANYDVTCEDIAFTVTPRTLVITLSDVSHTYDGEAYDFADGNGFNKTLCGGDEIECNVTYSDSPVNAGTYDVKFDENIVFVSGNANNYAFDSSASKLECKLTINEREITVTVKDRNVERGNEEYAKSDITAVAADGGAGFVAGDLEKATVTFSYADKLPLPANTVALKTVSVTFGGEVMKNYKIAEIKAGTLTVTERKVRVTPVFNGANPYVYDGNAVDINLFGYTHVHAVAGAAADDMYGFTAEDAANFTATYTFRDSEGNAVAGTPVNAGTYTVSITLSGAGLNGYHVDYRTLSFTIEKRPLSYTVEVQGAGEYVYSNSRPAFSATLAAGYEGFANGLPEHTFELFDGETPVTRYNVGTYTVKMKFAGMENYDITATTAIVKIVRRVIVVIPIDPFGGAAQTYNGADLTLGENDRAIASSGLENGDLAVGDTLTIESTSFAPTSLSGRLTIAKVNITDGGKDVSQNYTVYYEYNAVNPTIKGLGLRAADFQVRVSYAQRTIRYTLGEVGKTYPYTGERITHILDTDSAVSLAAGVTLGFGHRIALSQNSVTVPAEAGEYTDLVTGLVRIFDGDGRNVTAIYNLECDNPEKGVIKVTENVLTANLSGLTPDMLGKLDVNVSGLLEDASPAHQAEVYSFNLDGEWLIGITVFSESGAGKRNDLSANYKLDENCKLDGATVRLITLAQAEEYARPAIGVEITVTESELANGRNSLYSFEDDSWWVLKSGYSVQNAENLQEGHFVQVLVFRENGKYLLGVTIYSETNGRRSDVSNKYRLRELVKSDVAARYVTVSEAASLQREIYIDFSGVTADGNGAVTGCKVVGLNAADKHVVEITVGGDGGYEVAVYALSNGRKLNKYAMYELVYTAPAGVNAELKSGNLN